MCRKIVLFVVFCCFLVLGLSRNAVAATPEEFLCKAQSLGTVSKIDVEFPYLEGVGVIQNLYIKVKNSRSVSSELYDALRAIDDPEYPTWVTPGCEMFILVQNHLLLY
jgi:hypothetical protein